MYNIFSVFGEKNIQALINKYALETALISTIINQTKNEPDPFGDFSRNRLFDRNLLEIIKDYLI